MSDVDVFAALGERVSLYDPMLVLPDPPPDPGLLKLGQEAWTDEASMVVFADRLLLEGKIAVESEVVQKLATSWYAGHDPVDDALYGLECDARSWLLAFYKDVEMRVTGPWPDVLFLVWFNDGQKGVTTLCERVRFQGVIAQPRLLRRQYTNLVEKTRGLVKQEPA